MDTTILLLEADKTTVRAISRLVRPIGAMVLATCCDTQALRFCNQHEIKLIIANTRRPDIRGFLRAVNASNPQIRVLLVTTPEEMALDANPLADVRYFVNSWETGELRNAIGEELAQYHVDRDTADDVLGAVPAIAHKPLTDTPCDEYHAIAEKLCEQMEQRYPGSSHLAKRTAKTAGRLCKLLGVPATMRKRIMAAAEVHESGFLSLPDGIYQKSKDEMSIAESRHYRQYPKLGALALRHHTGWDEMAEIVKHHRDDYCGSNATYQKSGHEIPLGARIVRIASDLESKIQKSGLSDALFALESGSGKEYDPELVRILLEGTIGCGQNVPLLSRRVTDHAA
jgi:response regulator RpfG family c-di-GMP phosphodiesterase